MRQWAHSRIWNRRERGSGGVCVSGTKEGGNHPVLSAKSALSASRSLSSCPGCWPALHTPSILLPAKKKILFLVHNTGHSHVFWASGPRSLATCAVSHLLLGNLESSAFLTTSLCQEHMHTHTHTHMDRHNDAQTHWLSPNPQGQRYPLSSSDSVV